MTKPEGKNIKKIVNAIGKICMTFCCIGSIGAGFNFCWNHILTPMISGNTYNGSFEDKSTSHSANDAWRNSTLSKRTQ